MATLVELKQQRAKLASDMRSLHLEGGDKPFTDEQRSKWASMKSDLKNLDERIEREEETRSEDQQHVEDNAEEIRKKAAAASGGSNDERRAAAFDKFVRQGLGELDADERRALDELRAQSAGVPSEGGYTVPTTFVAKVHEALKAYGGIATVAQILTTDAGNPIEWPTSDGTNDMGELLGENSPASEGDVEFGMGSLGAHKISSKVIRVSNELLRDTGIDMESYLSGRIGSRVGRAEAHYVVKGTGASAGAGQPVQPRGLEVSTAVGATTAAADAFTWQEINKVIHSVDPAYRNAPKFRLAFNDNTLMLVENMEDDKKRPIWLPGIDAKAPATILGRQFVIDQGIADLAANAKFLYAGDFDHFIIRRVRYMAIKRLVERYAEYDQTGFLAFHRFGCVLQDTSAIKALRGAAGGGG